MNVAIFRLVHLLCGAMFASVLIGCGSGSDGSSAGGSSAGGKELSGVYLPEGEAIYERLEFQPGYKVAVTFMTRVHVAEYAVMSDGRVSIFGDKVQKLGNTGDGCLVYRAAGPDGVEIDLPDFGRYCRQ